MIAMNITPATPPIANITKLGPVVEEEPSDSMEIENKCY